jgi:hypothetical protein
LIVGPVGVAVVVAEAVDIAEEALVAAVVVAVPKAELLTMLELSLYTDNLFPAPQNSVASPGQVKLQSVSGAGTEPVVKEFPQ